MGGRCARIVCKVAREGNCASRLGGNATNREVAGRHLTEFGARGLGTWVVLLWKTRGNHVEQFEEVKIEGKV